MKVPRVTVSKLLVVVAAVAVNLAVGRALFPHYQVELYAGGLTFVIAQFAFFSLIRSRGLVRVFWVGFMFGGLVALTSLLYALSYRVDSPKSGSLAQLNFGVWRFYADSALAVVQGIYYYVPAGPFPKDDFLSNLFLTAIFFPSQLVAALSSGLLFRQIARWWVIRSETGDDAAQVPRSVD